jgi:hypothetical protein
MFKESKRDRHCKRICVQARISPPHSLAAALHDLRNAGRRVPVSFWPAGKQIWTAICRLNVEKQQAESAPICSSALPETAKVHLDQPTPWAVRPANVPEQIYKDEGIRGSLLMC